MADREDEIQSLKDEIEKCLADALQSDIDHATAIAHAHEVHLDDLANMEAALVSRDLIGQAKGVIIASLSCTADEAFALLIKQSQAENRKLVKVAEAISNTAQRRRRN